MANPCNDSDVLPQNREEMEAKKWQRRSTSLSDGPCRRVAIFPRSTTSAPRPESAVRIETGNEGLSKKRTKVQSRTPRADQMEYDFILYTYSYGHTRCLKAIAMPNLISHKLRIFTYSVCDAIASVPYYETSQLHDFTSSSLQNFRTSLALGRLPFPRTAIHSEHIYI